MYVTGLIQTWKYDLLVQTLWDNEGIICIVIPIKYDSFKYVSLRYWYGLVVMDEIHENGVGFKEVISGDMTRD